MANKVISFLLAQGFDAKNGRGSFELIGIELDGEGRFLGAGALGQFHYTHQSDYAAVRRQAEADTIAQYRRIEAIRGHVEGASRG